MLSKGRFRAMPAWNLLFLRQIRISMTDDVSKSAKILVVDDEPTILNLLEAILRDAGYTNISMTTDSPTAMSMFRKDNPDLVLLDLHMPQQDGYAILQTVRSLIPLNAFLPIIVLTADAGTEARRRALTLGATDFIAKPFDNVEVTLRIGNVLRILFLHRQVQNEKALLEQRVHERTRSLERIIAELRCAALPLFSPNL
jgi:DNA-binding response OmpR family regulator